MFERPEGIENCRIWIDGCFDFAHHGHAGAMLQARQLGKELYVGVHSDEEILANKGPCVMRLDERMTAVDACKWSTKAIPDAPYVTDPKVMDEYGCKYVVHGDDITTDANGEDTYQTVKDLGKFVVVKRTPNISTTDLVGRMLLMSKNHHYPDLNLDKNWQKLVNEGDNLDRFTRYATDETGLKPGSVVYVNTPQELKLIVAPKATTDSDSTKYVYIDGGFDLFHPGHIEVLRLVHQRAQQLGAKVIVGIHDDLTVNKYKGLNYPIMNIFERSLCVLQCRFVDGIVLNAPYEPTKEFLGRIGNVIKVYHGPTEVDETVYDGVRGEGKGEEAKGMFETLPKHKYDHMSTEFIVDRVLQNKAVYVERQKKKGWKAEMEKVLEANERNKKQQE